MNTIFFASGRTRVSILLVTGAMLLSGCANQGAESGGAAALGAAQGSLAELPRVVQSMPRIEAALTCIRQSQALKDKVFVVGPFADSTGKINSVALGATGAFVPQGGSAAYITDALTKAGGQVVSTYFGPPAKNVKTQYFVNGIFNSLDFAMPLQLDVRIAGIGPVMSEGWAQLSLTVQLDDSQTRINRQISMIERPVRYSQFGGGLGHTFGGTLITGTASIQNQERLQFEALNGPIALGVADVLMKQFPAAKAKCWSGVADLLTAPKPGADIAAGASLAGVATPTAAGENSKL